MAVYYITAALIVFALCAAAHRADPARNADLFGVSAMLILVCVIGNIIVEIYKFPSALLASPVLDFALAAMIFRAWQKNREKWKVVMVGTLVIQLAMHVVSIAMWKSGDMTGRVLHDYVVAVNAVFIIQLLTPGLVGAANVLGAVCDWLLRRWRSPALPDAGW